MMDTTLKELWLDHDGARLFAVEKGEGPTVLLLHGGMADHRACWPHLVSLSAAFRVVAPDQRSSGRSRCNQTLSFERLTDDLLAWMDDLNLTRAVIVGLSSGTGVAVHFALAHPGRVAGLGLVQPIYSGSEIGMTPEQVGIFSWMDGIARQTLKHGIEAIEPMYAAAPERFREQAIATAMEFEPASLVATSHFLASGEQPFRSSADLAGIQAPVLLIRGADPVHPSAVSDQYVRSLARVQEFEPADPMIEAKLKDFCAASLRR